MPKLGVRIRPAAPDLFHLEIYHGDTHIGDYERTKESEIPRKQGEIKEGCSILVERIREARKVRGALERPRQGNQEIPGRATRSRPAGPTN